MLKIAYITVQFCQTIDMSKIGSKTARAVNVRCIFTDFRMKKTREADLLGKLTILVIEWVKNA